MFVVKKARTFATEYHEGQKYRGQPYIEHLWQVATFLMLDLDVTDGDAIAAAYLHDILEDTQCTAELLEREFNQRINTIVRALTRDSSETSEQYITRIHQAGHYAMAVKTADRVCNLEHLIIDAKEGKLKPKLIERYRRELKFIQRYFPRTLLVYIQGQHVRLMSVL